MRTDTRAFAALGLKPSFSKLNRQSVNFTFRLNYIAKFSKSAASGDMRSCQKKLDYGLNEHNKVAAQCPNGDILLGNIRI